MVELEHLKKLIIETVLATNDPSLLDLIFKLLLSET